MPIQWYPGHMVKARRVLAETTQSEDIVIEVLDARMPAASSNPIVAEVLRHKPCLKVLSKSDLADPAVTRAWVEHFEADAAPGRGAVAALATTTARPGEAKARVVALCRRLVGRPGTAVRPLRATIAGVPNVGKSTLINTLAGRKVAAVGDVPAVTRATQKVALDNGFVLCDHPGLLWPRVDDDATSLRLALCGSIPDTAFDYENVAIFAAGFLLERYPHLVLARYKLAQAPPSADALLDEIARRRGGIRAGGVIDRHKAADVLVHDFRSGALGRVSLETPAGARAEADARAEAEARAKAEAHAEADARAEADEPGDRGDRGEPSALDDFEQ